MAGQKRKCVLKWDRFAKLSHVKHGNNVGQIEKHYYLALSDFVRLAAESWICYNRERMRKARLTEAGGDQRYHETAGSD